MESRREPKLDPRGEHSRTTIKTFGGDALGSFDTPLLAVGFFFSTVPKGIVMPAKAGIQGDHGELEKAKTGFP